VWGVGGGGVRGHLSQYAASRGLTVVVPAVHLRSGASAYLGSEVTVERILV